MSYVRMTAIIALASVGLSGANVIAQAPLPNCAALKQELATVKDVAGLTAYMRKAGVDGATAKREAEKAKNNIAGAKAQLKQDLDADCK